jgi:Domain of Unknown Function (DUF1080)
MRTPLRPIMTALVVASVSAPAAAQERSSRERQRTAILDPAEAGPDFADQGEYAGQVFERQGNNWLSRPFGLQVAAQGNGQFLAMLYPGGLPGAGWERSERLPLAGSRTDTAVELQGDGTYVTIASGTAKLASTSRQLLGELRKVYRTSPTLRQRPPAGAIVLFDGGDTGRLEKARTTPEGLLQEGAQFATPCRDLTLHLEFLLPYMPHASGQGRSNSGVYLQSRYEVQILDSFALEGVENECGALYRQRRPNVNMCYPPLAWQTYDVDFTSPRFDKDGNKYRNARITVRHNGVVVHDNVEVYAKTGGGSTEGPDLLPTKLQDHGNPVRFRNVWLVDREHVPQFVHAGQATTLASTAPAAHWSTAQRTAAQPAYHGTAYRTAAQPVYQGTIHWPSAQHIYQGSADWTAVQSYSGASIPRSAIPVPSLGNFGPAPQRQPGRSAPLGRPSSLGYHPWLYAPHYATFGPQFTYPGPAPGYWSTW